MKRFYLSSLLVVVFQTALLASELQQNGDNLSSALTCEIIEEANKNIRCTYSVERVAYDRNITFLWRSSETPHDDRERTIVLKANHGSLYDYRYYYGRAEGEWSISVADDGGNILADTSFTIH